MAHIAAAKAAMTSALLLLLAGCAGCAAPSEAKNASRGVLLPLAVARASVPRGRSLLRSGAFSVAGAIREGCACDAMQGQSVCACLSTQAQQACCGTTSTATTPPAAVASPKPPVGRWRNQVFLYTAVHRHPTPQLQPHH
jgi:hypothetical protein